MSVPTKILIPVLFALAIAAFFTATQPITPTMSIISSVFVVLFALPSYYILVKTLGKKKGLLVLAALGLYALAIESSAIHTSFPYGDFIYNDLLGQKVLGLTPWTVAFAWPPILLAAYWIARSVLNKSTQHILAVAALTALFAMLIDIVLDPAAVYLGFWEWREPGFFYGVPLINFLGWLLSGFIGAFILHGMWGAGRVPAGVSSSGIAIIWFWTIANIFMMQFIPVVVGFALLFFFFRKIQTEPV